jgi:cytochrome c-type biogenesis protein CcmH
MITAFLLALALQQAPAVTDDPVLEARTREVAAVLRCPVCQGLSINDSPSDLAVQMKSVIREQLRQGKSADEVKAYFVSKYGEWVLLQPKPSGVNLVVYAAPILMLIGGAVFIFVLVRKWSAGQQRVQVRGYEGEGETEG